MIAVRRHRAGALARRRPSRRRARRSSARRHRGRRRRARGGGRARARATAPGAARAAARATAASNDARLVSCACAGTSADVVVEVDVPGPRRARRRRARSRPGRGAAGVRRRPPRVRVTHAEVATSQRARRTISRSWRLPSCWQGCSGPTSPSQCGPTTGAASGRPTRRRRSCCARPTPCVGWSPLPVSSGSAARTSPATSTSKATSSPCCRCTAGSTASSSARPSGSRSCSSSASTSLRPLPPPPEEARLRGRRHSRARDAAAISYHYDLSNDFYELLLGPSLTYSCGVWSSPHVGLEAAQEAKHELVCRKLGLEPGMRLLDVGCGWGSMVLHAARHHGVRGGRRHAVAGAGRARGEAGGRGRARRSRGDPAPGLPRRPRRPVRRDQLDRHVRARRSVTSRDLLRASVLAAPPRGPAAEPRHQPCARGQRGRPRPWSRGFVDAYVFPDGELHEVGSVVSTIQRTAGSKCGTSRTCASTTRSRCAPGSPTSRRTGTTPSTLVGEARARVLAALPRGERGALRRRPVQVHQVLAVKPDGGASGMPLRPAFS